MPTESRGRSHCRTDAQTRTATSRTTSSPQRTATSRNSARACLVVRRLDVVSMRSTSALGATRGRGSMRLLGLAISPPLGIARRVWRVCRRASRRDWTRLGAGTGCETDGGWSVEAVRGAGKRGGRRLHASRRRFVPRYVLSLEERSELRTISELSDHAVKPRCRVLFRFCSLCKVPHKPPISI